MAEDGGSKDTQKVASSDEEKPEEKGRGSIIITNDNRHIYSHEPQQESKKPSWVEKGTLVVLFLTFCAALFAGIEAYSLASDTRIAVVDAEKATVISNRAWLAPRNIIASPDFKMGPDPPPGSSEIFFGFENVGKGPATHTRELIRITVILVADFQNPSALNAVFSDVTSGRDCKDVPPNPNGRTIFPGGLAGDGQNLTGQPRRNALISGYFTLAIGCLVYETMESTRWSEVCEILEPIPVPKGQWPTEWRTTLCPVRTQAY
jgi:hypothetical protein